MMKKPENIDEYVALYPEDVQERLCQLRDTILKAAPQAQEVMSYGMPAFKMNGMLVWIGAHTHHIGFYPRASGISAFEKELSGYHFAKGSVQFPNDKPLPLKLITEIVKYRVAENLQKAKKK